MGALSLSSYPSESSLCAGRPSSEWAWWGNGYLFQRITTELLELLKVLTALGAYGPQSNPAAHACMLWEFDSPTILLQIAQKLYNGNLICKELQRSK